MKRSLGVPIAAALMAIAITTTLDAMGLSDFSSLPLLPLAALLWWAQKHSRQAIGWVGADPRHFALAMLHPAIVIGALMLVASIAGAVDWTRVDAIKACLNALIVGSMTVVMSLLTEEGFFRGSLWASLARAGVGERGRLLATSLAFAAWHVSAATLAAGFRPPPAQAPILVLNALALGVIWGLMRSRSGSVFVASVGHGLWNGLAYALFGFGERRGALGVERTDLFSPEIGILGLGANLVFAAWLWSRRPQSLVAPSTGPPVAAGETWLHRGRQA